MNSGTVTYRSPETKNKGHDARPQSAREDDGDKNECSCCGIVSDDDLKIRVKGQFFKNWTNNSPILAPYWHAHWMPACQYRANTGSTYTDYCKILTCETIIGNQGGRNNVSKEV